MYKTRKCFDGEQEKSIDRLPDEILVHILSFVPPTKDCVRSSILAKRWRFLWARVPNLNFDSWDHKTLTGFSNFFNRFVFIHKGRNINTFRLIHDKKNDNFETETLFAAAVACNIKAIEIHSSFELVLPQCLFTSNTLADLMLNCLRWDSFPMVPMTGTSVYLPALKKLHLRNVWYESEETLVHLLSGCPALENLTIRKGVDKMVCVYVSSPTLTRLDLQIDYYYGDGDINKAFEVKLDTPALKYLSLHDSLSHNFSTGMLASLAAAKIYFYDHRGEYDILYFRSVLEFVGKLNNVSCLKLNTVSMEVPDSGLSTEFRNLTKLEFSGDWRLVTNFLEKSDNLEVLAIDMSNGFRRDWKEPEHVPVCMNKNLRTVRFDEFECGEIELNMVEYILRNARVLKRMVINVACGGNGLKEKYEALKRISLCERASVACQLVFD